MNLEKRLSRWQEAGLIDARAQEGILAFEKSQRRPFALYAMGVLGAGTVALGLVSIIASNWDAIPGSLKLGLDLALGAALAAACYVSVQHEQSWASEISITLLYGFSLASLGLVGQVYQLGTPAYQGLLVWTATTLPLLSLGRTRYLAALAWCGLVTTHAFAFAELFEYIEHALDPSRVRNLLAVLSFASPLLYLLLARTPWLVSQRPEVSRTFSALSWAVVLLGITQLPFLWYVDIDEDSRLGVSLLANAALTGALVAALPRLYPDLTARARLATQIILAFGWLTLAASTGFERESMALIGALGQLVILGLLAWASLELGSARAFNTFTALIALRVLIIYFEVFGSLLSTGVGLISGGALTLVIAYAWRRQTQSLVDRFGRAGMAQ